MYFFTPSCCGKSERRACQTHDTVDAVDDGKILTRRIIQRHHMKQHEAQKNRADGPLREDLQTPRSSVCDLESLTGNRRRRVSRKDQNLQAYLYVPSTHNHEPYLKTKGLSAMVVGSLEVRVLLQGSSGLGFKAQSRAWCFKKKDPKSTLSNGPEPVQRARPGKSCPLGLFSKKLGHHFTET